jgi:hypothetical protein
VRPPWSLFSCWFLSTACLESILLLLFLSTALESFLFCCFVVALLDLIFWLVYGAAPSLVAASWYRVQPSPLELAVAGSVVRLPLSTFHPAAPSCWCCSLFRLTAGASLGCRWCLLLLPLGPLMCCHCLPSYSLLGFEETALRLLPKSAYLL